MDQPKLTYSVPEVARLLGIGRDAAYAAAARGEIPTLRIGRRLVVPAVKLHELLGVTPAHRQDGPATHPLPCAVEPAVSLPEGQDEPMLRVDRADADHE